MSSNPSDNHEATDLGPAALPQGLSPEALARRKMLLSGATRGATAMAALTPIGALAGTEQTTVVVCLRNSDGKEAVCTVSGMNSATHSFPKDCIKRNGGGFSPGWWGQDCGNENPSRPGRPRRYWPIDPATKAGAIFNGASMELAAFTVMSDPGYSGTAIRHWIGAYLNACAYYRGGVYWGLTDAFPYKPWEVKALFANTSTSAAALQFFKDYMERHVDDGTGKACSVTDYSGLPLL